jgi:mono/diheme cytochrome c family protein
VSARATLLLALAATSCGAAGPTTVSVAGDSPAAGREPTFARDVAPIVHRRCSSCHHDGGSGPFPLVTHRDLARRLRQIEIVTTDRYMPPWPPVPGYGDFLDDRRLSDEELATLTAWIAAGGPLGDPEDLPPEPTFDNEWRLGEPDLVLEMAEPYTVPAEGFDVWRTFVVPTGLEDETYVRAIEFRPTNEKVVHHFIMYMDATDGSRGQDAADPGVGFEGMSAEVSLLGEEAYGWVTGMSPRPLPHGVATTIAPGTDFVLDTHFVPRGREEEVEIDIGLHFADAPPEVYPSGVIIIGPGATIPPGAADYTIGESFELPVDVQAMSIAPHAHYVCQRVDVWADLPDGRREDLLRIDDWDPDWQEIYRYRELVPLPAGTRIEMRFTYDNSSRNERNPFDPPRRIVTGKAAVNEMAIAWLNVVVEEREDLETLKQDCSVDYRANSQRANRFLDIWKSLVAMHDADADGTLDPEEDARATAYVNGIWDNVPHMLAGFDANDDGELDDEERAYLETVIRYWNGEPVE